MAAISSVTDLKLIDIERIVAESSTYIEDYKNKLEKGDVVKMVKTQESTIKSKMRSLIKSNKEKVQSIKELEKEYKVPFAELDVMWLQVKSKMGIVNKHAPKKNIAEEEVKEVMEEITTDKEEKRIAEELRENMKKVFPKEIEEAQKVTITTNGVFKELKIKSIEVEGTYGTYIKGEDGVKIDEGTEGRTFKDTKDLDKYRGEVEEDFKKTMKGIEKQLSALNEEKQELASMTNKKLNKIAEIELVFAM